VGCLRGVQGEFVRVLEEGEVARLLEVGVVHYVPVVADAEAAVLEALFRCFVGYDFLWDCAHTIFTFFLWWSLVEWFFLVLNICRASENRGFPSFCGVKVLVVTCGMLGTVTVVCGYWGNWGSESSVIQVVHRRHFLVAKIDSRRLRLLNLLYQVAQAFYGDGHWFV